MRPSNLDQRMKALINHLCVKSHVELNLIPDRDWSKTERLTLPLAKSVAGDGRG